MVAQRCNYLLDFMSGYPQSITPQGHEMLRRWSKAVSEFQFLLSKKGVLDPANEWDWFQLSIGFFLSKGCTGTDSEELATLCEHLENINEPTA